MSLLVERLLQQGRAEDIAVEEDVAGATKAVTYDELRARAAEIADRLRGDAPSLNGAPVAFLIAPSAGYVEALLGILLAGGTAVPLSPLHTLPELEHLLVNARPHSVLVSGALLDRLQPFEGQVRIDVLPPHLTGRRPRPAPLASEAPAIMLYTSGTTGKPKGVVSSHSAVAATCAALDQAWGWQRRDRLLHVLPLHHTHGVIVALLGALWAGATARFAPFEPRRVWTSFADVTVFMAVPTMYAKLMEAFGQAAPEDRAAWSAAARGLRLFTSGSAALPASLFESFREATSQTILERYGMTEIGMALSNPLHGRRVPGAVGQPLPGVTVDLVTDDGTPAAVGEPGELRVRSPQLFTGYHGDPDATAASFDAQGRFRTGDTGVRDPDGVIRILGRTSTDILKSGGYKLSALEIEAALREHPAIAEVAVVGLPDPTWGDLVTACIVLRPDASLTHDQLRAWAKDRLAPYKIPRALQVMQALPRNAMGKLQKKELIRQLTG